MVKEPQKLGDADIEKLKALVDQFPYFSLGHNLLVKALHNTKHYEYDKYLKQAALQVGSRAVLYNLVNNLPLETESEELLVQPIENLQIDKPSEIENKVEVEKEIVLEKDIELESIIETPVVLEPAAPIKDPNQIYEEEKLVQPTGKFVKFVPKIQVTEESQEKSLIPNNSETEELVLESFDIATINQEPQAPAYTPMFIEEEPIAIIENTIETPVETLTSILEVKTETDSAFFDWIAQKDSAGEEIEEKQIENSNPPALIAPSKMEEDFAFVNNFNVDLGLQANANLSTHIEENISRELPVIDEVVFEAPIEITPITLTETPNTTAISDPLLSLFQYEVNEYLAPLYQQVSYNENIFEDSFINCFGGSSSARVEWTEPFASLKQKTTAPISSETEIKKPVLTSEKPAIKPKIADLPTPKIARDPSTVESILEKFMRENPSIARPKSEFYSPMNMAKQSAEESEEILSETLAQIYTRQGLYKKAIVMYEKLGLHNPDKLPYFAGLILQIKSAHNID